MAADESNLRALLDKIAVEQEYSNPDIQITPLSTDGANYSSRLYRILISSAGKQDLQLFAKIAAMGEKMRGQCTLELYGTERYMYTDLVKIYRTLEAKCGLSEKHRLAVPKYYGADATHLQEIIVLEDLSLQDFTLHNRKEPVSWEYATAAVTELAKFHALSLAYKHNYPKEFEKLDTLFGHGMFSDHEGNQIFCNSSIDSAMGAVREENKDKLRRFMDSTSLTEYCSMYEPIRCPVLLHADFRPSNTMHKLEKDGTLSLMIVDYQTLQVGCPVIDLLYFIFMATDGKFRAAHYHQLVDFYHSQLGASLSRLGLDVEKVYPTEDFRFELKERLPWGLQLSVLALPVLLIEEDAAPRLNDELSMANFTTKSNSVDYTRRLNEVVDDYVAWGILK